MSDHPLIQQPPPIMIPIVLRDLAGREIEAQGPLDALEAVVGLPGFGAFRFVPTGEKQALTGHPVYVQESQRSKT